MKNSAAMALLAMCLAACMADNPAARASLGQSEEDTEKAQTISYMRSKFRPMGTQCRRSCEKEMADGTVTVGGHLEEQCNQTVPLDQRETCKASTFLPEEQLNDLYAEWNAQCAVACSN